jgi:hypothetical protein
MITFTYDWDAGPGYSAGRAVYREFLVPAKDGDSFNTDQGSVGIDDGSDPMPFLIPLTGNP